MAQISVRVSTENGSTITVSRMLCDECLAFETTVYLRVSEYTDIEPWVYAKDTVSLHGDPAAIRLLLEKCLAALDAREKHSPDYCPPQDETEVTA